MSLFLFLLLLAVVSCARTNPEDEAVRRLIGKYNLAVIVAYKDLNKAPLKDISTLFHFNRITGIIDAYLEGNQIMDAELIRLSFKDIKLDADKAEVRTSEDWKYKWLDYKTGAIAEPQKDIHYELTYHLVKKDNKWLVDRLEEVKK